MSVSAVVFVWSCSPSAPEPRDTGATGDGSAPIPRQNARSAPSLADETPGDDFPADDPLSELIASNKNPEAIGAADQTLSDGPVGPVPAPSATSLKLVSDLTDAPGGESLSTAEALGAWEDSYNALIGQGDDAVGAIQAFLQSQTDHAFADDAQYVLGFPSARMAMLTALAEIGTPGAVTVMAEALRTTATPLEIAALAHNLDTLAPEQFRAEAINASRETLEMAMAGELEAGDVAPLFDVLRRYGDASVVPVLEQSIERWRHYASTALADLPDGAGVPALIAMAVEGAESGSGANVAVLQSLARISPQNPDARSIIYELAQDGQVSARQWPYVAKALTGNKIQFVDSLYTDPAEPAQGRQSTVSRVASGSQNFITVPDPTAYSIEELANQAQFIGLLREQVHDATAAPFLREAQEDVLDLVRQLEAENASAE